MIGLNDRCPVGGRSVLWAGFAGISPDDVGNEGLCYGVYERKQGVFRIGYIWDRGKMAFVSTILFTDPKHSNHIAFSINVNLC